MVVIQFNVESWGLVDAGRGDVVAQRAVEPDARVGQGGEVRWHDRRVLECAREQRVIDFLEDKAHWPQPLRHAGGYPVLTNGMESSIPGLHFLGAPAAYTFGPLMRFVSGSHYAATHLARAIAPRGAAVPARVWWMRPAPGVELAG